MDSVVRYYLWAAVLLAILFLIISSNFVYWFTNRISTGVWGPKLYDFARGGPTLLGMLFHAIIFGVIVFGIVDYIYTELNNNKSIDENTIELS
jgi:hypothetical protein